MAEELKALAVRLADGAWHSGEALAREAGCTRAALAKRVQRLRDRYGLACEAVAGRGYRLEQPLDLIDASSLKAALAGRAGVCHALWQVDSTNRWLLDADPADDPQLCIAEQQTAGRGRRGRSWESPFAAGLMLSVAVRFESPSTGLGALPLALGTAVAGVLAELGVASAGLKWPNDLLCAHGKLGGLLCEARGEMGGSFRVVAGLGLNLRHFDALDTLDQPACALQRLLPAMPSRTELAARMGRALLGACTRYGRDGFAPFAADFAARDWLRDRPVTVHAAQPWQGTARGVNADGALRVERAPGDIVPVHAGDVTVRRA